MRKIKEGEEVLVINSWRGGRSPQEVGVTMTVDELIGLLEWYDPDTPVIVRGYDEFQFNYVDDTTLTAEVLE